MPTQSLKTRFAQFDNEYGKFALIQAPLSKRSDVHAFILLDRLVPGSERMIGVSEHDEFYLGVDPDSLNAVATDEQIRELVRCRVRYDESTSSLCLFT